MIKNFSKIAIANRGEVAVRIIRSAKELGISTLLLHSEADRDSLAYRISDEQICIGASPAMKSYLNLEAVLIGALSGKAEALHPGFGFLSENPYLPLACKEKDIEFIGPSAECLRLLGKKHSVCQLAQKLGIPVLPFFPVPPSPISLSSSTERRNKKEKKRKQDKDKLLKEWEEFLQRAKNFPYPLMAKMSEGGGGRGLRKVNQFEELEDALESAMREGRSFFQEKGKDREEEKKAQGEKGEGQDDVFSEGIFLEKYLSQAKHVEFQMFGGANGYIYCLGERDGSLQRRNQKVIEEAPASYLSEKLKHQIKEAAFVLMKNLGTPFKNAATVEFLVKGEEFYFLEVNPRLQVEHPVTEVLTGVDLVKAQILTAQNKPVFWERKPEPFELRGHAIECRIFAEDPFHLNVNKDILPWPSTGILGSCSWPHGAGRRFDVGFEKGDEMTPFYDSLLAKVIVWDETRLRAIKKMRQTLKECILFGLKTNVPYLISLLESEDFVSWNTNTQFISKHFSGFSKRQERMSLLKQDQLSEEEKMLAKKIHKTEISSEKEESFSFPSSSSESERENPWTYTWDTEE